jgi:hypothetical protein
MALLPGTHAHGIHRVQRGREDQTQAASWDMLRKIRQLKSIVNGLYVFNLLHSHLLWSRRLVAGDERHSRPAMLRWPDIHLSSERISTLENLLLQILSLLLLVRAGFFRGDDAPRNQVSVELE